MNKCRPVVFGSMLTLISLLLSLSYSSARQSEPTETKGMTVVKTTASDLGPEIEGMQGRQLRMRVLEMEPGGTIATHKQTDRPEVIYIIRGSITEYLNGNPVQRQSGDTWSAGKETTHGIVNTGSEPALIVVTDILKMQ
jgi:quercetin dioxygenase-like cupin family protein